MNAQTILGIDPGKSGAIAVLDEAAIFCEFVGARPTDAKTAAFAFGRARGVIEGCAGALGLPIVFLTPLTWRRLADIPPGAEKRTWPARARSLDGRHARISLTASAMSTSRSLPGRACRFEEGAR